MLLRKLCAVIILSLLLILGQAEILLAGQPLARKQGPEVVTETFRIMGKGSDHIVVGEQHLFVVPEITKITSAYGTTIELRKLRTPCLAEVSYSRWYRGVEKRPVVLQVKVKKVYRGASSDNAQE